MTVYFTAATDTADPVAVAMSINQAFNAYGWPGNTLWPTQEAVLDDYAKETGGEAPEAIFKITIERI